MNSQMLCLTVVSAMCMTMVTSSPYWYKEQDMGDYVDIADAEPVVPVEIVDDMTGPDTFSRSRKQLSQMRIAFDNFHGNNKADSTPVTTTSTRFNPRRGKVRVISA